MKNYLHLFNSKAEHDASYNGSDYHEPWVAFANIQDSFVTYNKDKGNNGHAYVDLGLPSGTLWATMNIGANSESDFGDYFAWGEVVGYSSSQVGVDKNFTQSDYRFPFDQYDVPSKYNYTDNLTTLELEDDAARVYFGGLWHIPSETQFGELVSNTTSQWVSDYQGSGKAGRLYTASNGKSVFLPAAGNASNGVVNMTNSAGYYWSNSIGMYGVDGAYSHGFSSYSGDDGGSISRYLGFSVRPVIG